MRVLYLFNNPVGHVFDKLERGETHDSHLFGMLRVRNHGIESDYLEIERFVPAHLATWLRRHVLTMHYVHLPLFPLFFRYDVVFTSTAYGCLLLKGVLRIKRFKWVLLDFNVLGTMGREETRRQKLFAWAVSKVDGIVTISQAEADALKVRFPHLERIIFLHEATDLSYFAPEQEVAEEDAIISVGMYGRDFDTLIKASEGLGVRCMLATKLILHEAARTLPAHITVGVYDHLTLRRMYGQAKIAYVGIDKPDDYHDSVGTFAVIEAMAMGKPTVVTHMNSMESYIAGGETGVFVAHHDVEALHSALTDLLENEEKRKRIGQAARAWAAAHVDPDLFAEKLAVYLRGIV